MNTLGPPHRRRWPRRRLRRVLPAVFAALLLIGVTAACTTTTGGGGRTATGGTFGDPADDTAARLEQTTVRVGVLPIVDVAAVQRAQVAGYYAAEGLTVELVTVAGGAVAIPQLVAGDLDLTWSSWTSVIAAHHKQVADLRALRGASYSAAPGTFMMMIRPAAPGTEIRTPQDLAGKRIAINTFGSITELATRSALQTNGVDPNRVTFVEIPFPDMIPALAADQVDAISVVEPQLTQASVELGAVPILDVAAGPTANLPEAGLVTTADYARTNPTTLAAFGRAIARAQADMADRSIVEQTLPTYAKVNAETASLLRLGVWPAMLTETGLQRIADLMTEFGQLPGPYPVTPLLDTPAP